MMLTVLNISYLVSTLHYCDCCTLWTWATFERDISYLVSTLHYCECCMLWTWATFECDISYLVSTLHYCDCCMLWTWATFERDIFQMSISWKEWKLKQNRIYRFSYLPLYGNTVNVVLYDVYLSFLV